MTLSMTGYGKAQADIGKRKISIELRSLNSKQFDLSMRILLLKEKETGIRNEIQKRLNVKSTANTVKRSNRYSLQH